MNHSGAQATPPPKSTARRERQLRRLAGVLPALRNRFRAAIPAEARVQFHESMGAVTAAQLEALVLLHQSPDGLTMHELVSAQSTTPSAATQLVDRLERMELVERGREEGDRRVVRVTLTKTARDHFEELVRMRTASLNVVTASLSDQELETLIGLFEKLAAGEEGNR